MLFSCLPWCCLKCAATKTRRAWSLVEGWSGACTVVIVCWFIYVCNEDHFLHTVHGHFTSGIILQVLEENVLNRQFKVEMNMKQNSGMMKKKIQEPLI